MYMHSYGEGFPYRFHKDILLPHKPIKFEGYSFPGPANPKEFCRLLYQNYMDLPHIENRGHHLVTYKIWN